MLDNSWNLKSLVIEGFMMSRQSESCFLLSITGIFLFLETQSMCSATSRQTSSSATQTTVQPQATWTTYNTYEVFRPAWGPRQPLIQLVPGCKGAEAWSWPLSFIYCRVNNEWNCASTMSYTFIAWTIKASTAFKFLPSWISRPTKQLIFKTSDSEGRTASL
jgi:hypothetical protein